MAIVPSCCWRGRIAASEDGEGDEAGATPAGSIAVDVDAVNTVCGCACEEGETLCVVVGTFTPMSATAAVDSDGCGNGRLDDKPLHEGC